MNIKELIDRKLDEENKKIVNIVSKVADQLNYRAYLVGGIVRDFFICRENFDIDIVIEGDLYRLAKALEKNIFIKKVKFMQNFLTAKVYLKQKHIDISAVRRETYPMPAVLPHVEPADNIEEDLRRRDFCINAMAVRINKKNYGQLIDKFGGVEDIRKKKIRILHQESFIDDPTRIFRALRYATRYKYHIERNTLSLIRDCIKLGIVKLLTPDRIRNEMILLLKGDKGPAMVRLRNLGLFNLLGLNFNIKEDIMEVFSRIESMGSSWVEKFMYLLDGLMKEDIEKILNFFKFESIILKKLRNIHNLDDILDDLKKATKNSQLFHSLILLPNELIFYMLAKFYKNYVIRKKLLHYLEYLKNTKSLITGEDLINIGLHPSPLFKKILKEIQDLQLDGVLKNKTDAELYIIKKYKT